MGDSIHTISGFGSALRNLATYLHKQGHEVYTIGWQTFGQKFVASFHEEILGFTVLPNIGAHRFGQDALKYWLPIIQPDLLLVLADFWMISYIYKSEMPYPYCHWYPIDGIPVTDQIMEMLRRTDYRVCISNWGADLVRAEGLDTYAITHGVKTKVFKPLREAEKLEMKAKIGIPADNIVIGRIDRNKSRKKIPRTILAFAKLHKEYPNTSLLLWMDRSDHEGWDLPFIIKRFGLKEDKDVFFPPPDMMANFMYGVDEKDLAAAMNVVDIHCWLTGGEGFGLTGLETMACGAVNVATDYTTPKEIFGNWTCAVPVKVEFFEVGNAGVDRAFASVDDAYDKMKYLIESPDVMKGLRENGIKRAKEVYDWDLIVKQWDKYIRENIK